MMKLTTDALKLRKLEADLVRERQQRLELAQKLGGVNSLNTRLRAALMVSRAEVEKLKADRHA
jgi:hypothetical protein